MSIALDTAGGNYGRGSNATSQSFSFNNVAGTTLVVGFCTGVLTDVITNVTYNGVAMTKAVQSSVAEFGYLYTLANPATGTNNVTITASAGVSFLDVGVASYTGIDLSSPVDNTYVQAYTNTSPITQTIVSVADNCWMFVFSGGQRDSTASTNSTRRSGNVAGGGHLYDSNAPITPAGSFSMSQIITPNSFATAVAMTLKPAGAAPAQSARRGVVMMM